MGRIWSAVFCFGGKTGIRTLGTVARSPHFECGKKVWGNSEIRGGKWSFAGLFPSWRLNLTI